MLVLRAGQRVAQLPGIGVTVSQKRTGGDAWWLSGGAPTPIVVYQPKGAASLAASYTNLVTPGTYNAAPGVAPTFNASTGWTFGGSQYLRAGVTPTDGYAAVVRIENCALPLSTACAFGSRPTGTTRFYIMPNMANVGGSSLFAYGNQEIHGAGGTNITTGVLALTNTAGYVNGTKVVTITGVFTGLSNEILIGARDGAFGAEHFLNGSILAVAIWTTSTNHATWMPAVMAAVALI